LVVAFNVAVSTLGAQQMLGNREDTELPFKKGEQQFKKFVSGEVAPDAAKDKALLAVAAEYLVYRVTWAALQSAKYEDGMGKVQADLEKVMSDPATKAGKNKEFMKLLSHQLIDCLKKVLGQKMDSTTSMAVTNAALMLPTLAKCKQPEVSDFLVELTKTDDKGNPVVHPFIRMCAIKGMGELNAPGEPVVEAIGDAKAQAEKSRREQARLDAIVKFIDSPYPLSAQDQEHQDALVYARREGVKALAQFQAPALELGKTAVKGPVAYHLLKVASGSPVKGAPPYTLAERLDAAVGICQLKPVAKADLSAFVIANLMPDLANAYAEDFAFFNAKLAKDEPKRQSLLPWKLYAERLKGGLITMQNNLKDPKDAPKVQGLKTNVDKMLKDISGHKQIDMNSLVLIQQDAEALRPATGEVYPGNKEYVLPLPAK
jgi:hypothetical protein